jgi:hypothetical protein
MWKPRRLTMVWDSAVCYRDSYTFIREWFKNELTACQIIKHRKMAESENKNFDTAYLVSLPRRLVAGLPPWRAWFEPSLYYVRFVVEHVTLEGISPTASLSLPFHIVATDPYLSVNQSWPTGPISALHTNWNKSVQFTLMQKGLRKPICHEFNIFLPL